MQMDTVQFNCPDCDGKLEVVISAERPGEVAKCPGCGHEFTVIRISPWTRLNILLRKRAMTALVACVLLLAAVALGFLVKSGLGKLSGIETRLDDIETRLDDMESEVVHIMSQAAKK